ncbi:SDR family oxidoreductase [Zhouia sp. PK063]|uniref:SDR family oxidoreductase n=1 Tax=Zhouia sp. PK063 TaxID=3373602 RepID=UPI0037A4F25D
MENNKTVLVTGGNGFVGLHIILQLLQKNYNVVTTIRKEEHIHTVQETLKANGITTFDNLKFVIAELTNDANWAQAMQGCDGVLSVASPVFFHKPENEEEAIKPAVDGILRILKFAKQAKVKRVVMTSNFGAVGFTQTNANRITTENDWTDIHTKGVSVYEKSKTIAEKAAWNFIAQQGDGLEFATINAVAILGPSLNGHVSGSFVILENLLNGKLKAIPKIPLNVVDVRDVAYLHIKALETPQAHGKRFIAAADGQISMPEMAQLIKNYKPEIAAMLPQRVLPNWVIKLAAIFNHTAKEGLLFLKMNRNISTQQARNILNWTPITTQEETILLAVDALIKYNIIKSK